MINTMLVYYLYGPLKQYLEAMYKNFDVLMWGKGYEIVN